MKKVTIAAVLVLAIAGTTMAQTAPKKSKSKMEMKKDSTSMSSDTTAMKHHKGMKHSK